jgi:hypothetical protein
MAPGPPPPQYASPTPAAPQLPGWLGPLVTITTQVGVPTVVAGVLLWFVLFRIDGAMKDIQEQEDTRTRMVAAMQDAVIAALERNADRFEKAIDKNIAFNQTLVERYHAAPPR